MSDSEDVICYGGARPSDNNFADIVAVDAEILGVVAPRLISFDDAHLTAIFYLASGMSEGWARALFEPKLRVGCHCNPTDREISLAIRGCGCGRFVGAGIRPAVGTQPVGRK